MVKRVETVFTCWELTEEELLEGSVFSDLQKKYIQTELALAAQEKLLIVINAEDKDPLLAFQLAHAEKHGYISAMKFLLGISDDKKDALQELYEAKKLTQTAN